ncbi:MAG: glycerol-3-phosphate dehydrogenase subunit GlpB [Halobacteriales archaeon]
MAIESDVLVIGGGIAGTAAALAAADAGADVRLVSAKESTLRHASGLIDTMGYPPGGEGPVADPFAALEALPEGHPYERAGADALREGLALFDGRIEGYRGGHTDRNALVPTHGGTVKPTARYPASVAPGLASDPRETLLVGFERLPDFDAPLAAAHLGAAGVPFEVRGRTVEFPAALRDDTKVTRYARLLEDGDVRGRLADRIAARLDGAARVGVPAVLGEEAPADVRTDLADRLGTDVFEIPTGPPSLLGLRLEERLYDALEAAGVSVATSTPVVDHDAADGRIETVYADRNGSRIPYAAGSYVLATGGLVGKGIESDREAVREPVLGCHVPHPEDRYDWFDDDAFGEHPFARFGVAVDRELRPLDAAGAPEYANLRAAGAVIGGADFAAEKSGGGISLATGYRAGRLSGEPA